MKISLRWLNDYLDHPVSVEEGCAVLTDVGFPIESREEVGGGDWRLDVEVTSNRGDVLCHAGLAREISARTGRRFVAPKHILSDFGPSIEANVRVENRVPEACPLFTARLIRGVRVGPSPAWLRERLEAAGQRSINNVVDVTNFINLELGNPCHAFDLGKLGEGRLVVRWAHAGEKLTTLDGKARALKNDELVVADGSRAQGFAGVMGGGESEVTDATRDVVLEVATWEPTVVRRASRRHGLRTDASHRYERIVGARTLEEASRRGAGLIAEVSGGRVAEGVISIGTASMDEVRVTLRPRRCREILGYELHVDDMVRALAGLGIECAPLGRGGEELLCTIPAWRADLAREIDLIEEVARIRGLDAVPLLEKLPVRVGMTAPRETAVRLIRQTLSGLGLFETVTFTFASRAHGALFLRAQEQLVEVDDERRAAEPALRASILNGLLACRRSNQHAHVLPEGGVRLFEIAQVMRQAGGRHQESRKLALLCDVPGEGRKRSIADRQLGLRMMRGFIECIARITHGSGARVDIEPCEPVAPAWDRAACGRMLLNGACVGEMGLMSAQALAAYDLDAAVVGAEFELEPLLAGYPPKTSVAALPQFPGTERDISLIVTEDVTWARIEKSVMPHRRAPLEDVRFVTTYRGGQIGAGKKSVTLRLSFRDPGRTLQSEEADAPTAALVAALSRELGATLRA